MRKTETIEIVLIFNLLMQNMHLSGRTIKAAQRSVTKFIRMFLTNRVTLTVGAQLELLFNKFDLQSLDLFKGIFKI
jgi:hypothetical protein